MSFNTNLNKELVNLPIYTKDSINSNFDDLKQLIQQMQERQKARNASVAKGFEDLHKYTTQVNAILDKYQNTIEGITAYLEYTIPIMNLSNRLSQQHLQLEFILLNMENDKHDSYLDTILSLPWYKKIFHTQRRKIKEKVDKQIDEMYEDNINKLKESIAVTENKLKQAQAEEEAARINRKAAGK